MSDSNDRQDNELETNPRFAHLNEQAKKAAAERAEFAASYREVDAGNKEDAKAHVEAVNAEAEVQRRPKLDPLELIRQLDIMRKEGVDDGTIRAAFEEIMNERQGIRRQSRRVVRSEGMVKMLSQDEMNRHYAGLVYGKKDGETDDAMDERVKLILDRMEQTKHLKLEVQKPTIKMYAYRVAYFLLRHPLQFAISVLTKIRKARNKQLPDQNQQLIKDLENLVKSLEK